MIVAMVPGGPTGPLGDLSASGFADVTAAL